MTTTTTAHVYVDVAEAREVYAEQHELNRYPADIREMLTPEFPAGTREYAEYVTALRASLSVDKPFGNLFD